MPSTDTPALQEIGNKMNQPHVPLHLRGSDPAPRMIGVKIAVFFAFVIALAALGAAFYLFQNIQSERAERATLEAANIQLQDRLRELDAEGEKYREESDRMREQLKIYADERSALKQKLDERDQQNLASQEKITALESRIRLLETPSFAAAPVAQAPGAAPVEGQAPAVPGPVVAQVQPAGKSIQVMTVNRKFNFVVINSGLEDRIKMGDKFAVLQNGAVIATVQVEKPYDRFSAAAILQEAKESPIKEGDPVRFA